MKSYTVSFERKAVYIEKGYMTVEAEDAKEAKFAAIELLESGANPVDYDGDVVDLDYDAESNNPDFEMDVQVTDVEKEADLDDEEE